MLLSAFIIKTKYSETKQEKHRKNEQMDFSIIME